MFRSTIVMEMFTLLLIGILLPTIANVAITEGERVIRIIDAETGSLSITLGDETQPLPSEGYKFTVNVTLEGATDFLFKYQVAIAFDNAKVRCTGAWITRTDPDWVFYGETGTIMGYTAIYNDLGFAAFGSILPTDYVVPDHGLHHYVNVSRGLLCQFNFTAINTGTSTLEIIPTESSDYPYDTFLWDKDEQYISFTAENFSLTVLGVSVPPPQPVIVATVDICPSSLNLRSKGKWITAYIELPEGYDVDDINISSITLNNTVLAELKPANIGDYDNDTTRDLMVKLDRADVLSFILDNVDVAKLFKGKFMTVTLTLTGKLNDGTPFQGTATIRIILKMPRHLRILTMLQFLRFPEKLGVFRHIAKLFLICFFVP